MDATVVGSIVAVGGTALGGLWQYLRSRPREKAKDALEARQDESRKNNERYDQLQQDLAEERKARLADSARLVGELKRQADLIVILGADIRTRDDYISLLRQWIDERKSPPPPPWPVSLTKGPGR